MRCVTGDDIAAVSALLNGRRGDVETDAQLLARLRGGAIGTIHASWSSRVGPRSPAHRDRDRGHAASRQPDAAHVHRRRRQPRAGRAARRDELAARRAPRRDRGERAPSVTAADGRAAVAVVRSRVPIGRARLRADGGRLMPRTRSGLRHRDHHAAHAGAARGLHRRPTRHRGARRPRGARALPARRARRRCASSCATCSACRPGSRIRSATRSRPRSGSTAPRCSRRASTRTPGRARSKAAISSAGSLPTGYRETLVRAVRRRRARGAVAAATGARCAPGGGRCPPGSLDQPARPAVRPDVRGRRRDRRRRRAHRHGRERLDPSGRARARVSRGVERLGRTVSHRARAAGRRHRDPVVGRDRRREPVPRPPPGQRLRRRRVRRGRATRDATSRKCVDARVAAKPNRSPPTDRQSYATGCST